MFEILSNPFNVENTTGNSHLDSELHVLRSDSVLSCQHAFSVKNGRLSFFGTIDYDAYPHLVSTAKKFNSIFGTTYACESAFSRLSYIKNKSRTRLTNENLDALMRVNKKYVPNYSFLSSLHPKFDLQDK